MRNKIIGIFNAKLHDPEPFAEDCGIDLSGAAAKKLDMKKDGSI